MEVGSEVQNNIYNIFKVCVGFVFKSGLDVFYRVSGSEFS